MPILKTQFTQEKHSKWNWADHMKKGKKIPRSWKLVIQGLPLAAAASAAFLPLQRLGQQFIMLVVLLWLQVFFIVECFFAGS
jgi:hypothetical protein